MTMQMIRIIEEFVGKKLMRIHTCKYYCLLSMYVYNFFIFFAPYTNTNSRYEYEYEYTNRCEYDY